MRFTESWRSVKTDGWGISKAGVGSDTNKLNAALKLIDYAYSPEGTILMSYGPEAFRNDAVTFLFNGKEMPTIADATYAELWEKASGNYTNYARQFLGSTLSFMKSQAFEYQCTHEVGREGAAKISAAIGLGTIKHPQLAVAENAWYTSVPTVLPTTKEDNESLGKLTDLTEKFGTAKDSQNLLVDIIAAGFTAEGMTSAEEAASYVKDTMGGAQYLDIKEIAWEELLDYYASLGN
jgi:putative aldouronate transport system substrate-binding protein